MAAVPESDPDQRAATSDRRVQTLAAARAATPHRFSSHHNPKILDLELEWVEGAGTQTLPVTLPAWTDRTEGRWSSLTLLPPRRKLLQRELCSGEAKFWPDSADVGENLGGAGHGLSVEGRTAERFEALFAAHRIDVLRYVLRRVSPDVAEDVVSVNDSLEVTLCRLAGIDPSWWC